MKTIGKITGVMFTDVIYLGWRGKEERRNKADADPVLQRSECCAWIKAYTHSEV